MSARRDQRSAETQPRKGGSSTWRSDTTVRRFPGAALALILGLAAALAAVMILSVGGWGFAIPGLSKANTVAQPAAQSHPGSPATETKPTTGAVRPVHQAGQPSGPGTP